MGAAPRGTQGGKCATRVVVHLGAQKLRWHPLCSSPSASASCDSRFVGETAAAEAERSKSSARDSLWAPRHKAAPVMSADDIDAVDVVSL